MPVSLEVDGLKGIQEILKIVESINADIKGVNLNSVPRQDSDVTNAEILDYMAKGNNRKKDGSAIRAIRAFKEVGQDESEQISQAGLDAYKIEIEKMMKTLNATTAAKQSSKTFASAKAFTEGGDSKLRQQKANAIATKMFKAAMEKYMSIVQKHIEEGTGPDGAQLDDPKLSDAYARDKLREVGFDYPIGKKSEQLLDNLTPGSGKIKVTR